MKEPLSAEAKLLIQETVERRLKELPASTYQLIEKMVHDKVASVERFWRNLIIIGGIVFTVVGSILGAGFFVITAKNASKKVSETIASSAVGEKLKIVETNYARILSLKNQVEIVGPEALRSATAITVKLKELESQDNIVRMNANGNLVLNLQDGELRLRRKNTDAEIMLRLDNEGRFLISDATNIFDPLGAKYYILQGGTTKLNR